MPSRSSSGSLSTPAPETLVIPTKRRAKQAVRRGIFAVGGKPRMLGATIPRHGAWWPRRTTPPKGENEPIAALVALARDDVRRPYAAVSTAPAMRNASTKSR